MRPLEFVRLSDFRVFLSDQAYDHFVITFIGRLMVFRLLHSMKKKKSFVHTYAKHFIDSMTDAVNNQRKKKVISISFEAYDIRRLDLSSERMICPD